MLKHSAESLVESILDFAETIASDHGDECEDGRLLGIVEYVALLYSEVNF